jgi:flagellar protein FliO/FliZ
MDMLDLLRYAGALLLVLALVGLAGLAARRFGIPGIASAKSARRLAVVETLMLDARHKLCLVRRDQSEHLIVIGPQGTAVLETGVPAESPLHIVPSEAAA